MVFQTNSSHEGRITALGLIHAFLTNKRILILCLFFLINPFLIHAQKIEGTGYAEDQSTARELALSDLAAQISVDIRSNTELIQEELIKGNSGDFQQSYRQNVITRSEFPLFGVELEYMQQGDEIRCMATMDVLEAGPLYQEKAQEIHHSIKNSISKSSLDQMSITELDQLVINLKDLESIGLIAKFFGMYDVPKAEYSLSQVSAAINQRGENIKSLTEAVNIIHRKLGHAVKRVYVHPPTYEGNKEITSFAKTMRDRLNSKLASTKQQNRASEILTGIYRDVNGSLELTFTLRNDNYESISGITIKLTPEAYGDYSWKPTTTNIDQLIDDGVVLSSDLTVQLSTNKGGTDLIFEEGEMVELLVKANQSAYIYIIAHNMSAEKEFSYFIPFSNGDTKRDMILFINADDVNHWISLGEFEVHPPFGVERLQVFASSEDPIDLLPEFHFNADGYPEVGIDPGEVVNKTRGLIRKKKKESEVSEASLIITTLPK